MPILPFKEDFCHHNNRRKIGHDYCAPWKYHITITKAPGCPDFSKLEVKTLSPDGVSTKFTPLGILIWRSIKNLQSTDIKIYRFAIMPDHIHLLIHVTQRLPEHLGFYIARFKSHVTTEWRNLQNDQTLEVFNKNYNDRLILPEHSLDSVYQYILHNPYRLAVRRVKPDFFRKTRNLFANDREIQAYGNLFLLRNPFKIALVIHRADSDEVFDKKKQDCLYYALNGGVVVSAFISQREREIRSEIENAGGRIILVHDRPFTDRQKPAKHNFELCCDGQMLLISYLDYATLPKAEHPSRSQCLDMNNLAKTVASEKFLLPLSPTGGIKK